MSDGRGLSMGELLARGERSFSFEFFPPKDEAGEQQLWQRDHRARALRPTFVSVTYGAGGTTRDRTVAITGRIARETALLPVAHLTCVGHTTDELSAILDDLSTRRRTTTSWRCAATRPAARARRGRRPTAGSTYATELVALIRERADMRVGVAAFPEGHVDAARPRRTTPGCCKAKYDAGAEFAVTEMVLRASDYVAPRRAGRGGRRRPPDHPGHHADPEPRARWSGWSSSPGASCPRRSPRGSSPSPTTRTRSAPRAS